MTTISSVISSKNNHILTLTLNRPEFHNAFDEEMIKNLIEKLTKAEADSNIRVVILAATGKSFCAGADLNWMRKMINYTYEENLADAKALADLMQILALLAKPTIALVQGPAYGGGVGLIACCDIAIASEEAIFCFSETKVGLVPAVISPYIIKAIGQRLAQRYFLTAEVFDANEAVRIGLIHKIVGSKQLFDIGHSLAKMLLENSPQALHECKKLINKITEINSLDEIINFTTACIANIRVTTEGQEGLKAFLEKRKPNW